MRFLINDACSIKDYFDIGDLTWTNLMNQVSAYINSEDGASFVNQGQSIRPDYIDIKEKLESNMPIQINCD